MENKFSRRDALGLLTKVIAIATGMSTASVRQVFAQLKSVTLPASSLTTGAIQRLKAVKASSRDAKILKLFLISERQVYVNEFGRLPQMKMQMDPTKEMIGCNDFFSPFVTSGTHTCTTMTGCTDNKCRDQICGKNSGCNGNDCVWQRPSLNNRDVTSLTYLNRMKNDPFVKALFKELHVTSVEALSKEVRNMLGVSRMQTK